MVEQKRLDWKWKQARLWCGSVTSCWNTSPGTGWLRTTEHILPCLEARGLQSRCRQAVFFWGLGRQPTDDYVWLQAVLGTPWLELHHPVSASFTTRRPSLVSCFYVFSSLGKTLDMGFRDCSTVTFFFFPESPHIGHAGLEIINRWIYKHVPLCFAYLHLNSWHLQRPHFQTSPHSEILGRQ